MRKEQARVSELQELHFKLVDFTDLVVLKTMETSVVKSDLKFTQEVCLI
jgi:hypothetical protein